MKTVNELVLENIRERHEMEIGVLKTFDENGVRDRTFYPEGWHYEERLLARNERRRD